jgi:hypothetical protein
LNRVKHWKEPGARPACSASQRGSRLQADHPVNRFPTSLALPSIPPPSSWKVLIDLEPWVGMTISCLRATSSVLCWKKWTSVV